MARSSLSCIVNTAEPAGVGMRLSFTRINPAPLRTTPDTSQLTFCTGLKQGAIKCCTDSAVAAMTLVVDRQHSTPANRMDTFRVHMRLIPWQLGA